MINLPQIGEAMTADNEPYPLTWVVGYTGGIMGVHGRVQRSLAQASIDHVFPDLGFRVESVVHHEDEFGPYTWAFAPADNADDGVR